MMPYYAAGPVEFYLGDCLKVMASVPDRSIHAVVCDPPYGLTDLKPQLVAAALAAWLSGDRAVTPGRAGFMGRSWDRFVPPPAAWDECYRVLKPGGWLLAFAAPRTADLMGLSIRLAGFSLTDSLHWVNGQGFPKAKSRLKPAHEPIIMARKPARADSPLPGLDGCRAGITRDVPASLSTRPDDGRTYGKLRAGQPQDLDPDMGRWPPNLLLVHDADCWPAGTRRVRGCGGPKVTDNGGSSMFGIGRPGHVYGEHGVEAVQAWACAPGCPVAGLDWQSGALNSGASRFFPQFTWDPEYDLPFLYCAKAPKSERPRLPDGTSWPTVKPLAVMRWLVRLVTPPGGTVLDPFAGTGPTGQACALEGFRCILIDQEPVAAQLAVVRLSSMTRKQPRRP